MNDNKKRILEMLAENKITVDEAERLLSATGSQAGAETNAPAAPKVMKEFPKYLRVVVEPDPDSEKSERVNIRVPMGLIRAGMKLTSLIPPHASDKMSEAMREKGIDFDLKNIKPEDLDELVAALSDLEVNVDGKEKIRVYAE
jgi:hypothetical protein